MNQSTPVSRTTHAQELWHCSLRFPPLRKSLTTSSGGGSPVVMIPAAFSVRESFAAWVELAIQAEPRRAIAGPALTWLASASCQRSPHNT
jgi:hypothetical protein